MKFWDLIAQETHLLSYPDTPYGPVGLIYPNVYPVGIANLGYQQIYRLFKESGFSVERVFFDKKGRETRSVENQTPLFRFPILAASYTYELDIVNLFQMLIRGGVAPLSKLRGDGAPLLIVGGQAASANPRLLQRIADVVYLGEGEEILPLLCEKLSSVWNKTHSQMLEAIAEFPHIYVPKIHGEFDRRRIFSHTLDPIDKVDCHSVILSPADEFGGSFLLEMSRGCKYTCKFCIVHSMNGTARYRDFNSLIGVLDRFQSQYRKVGLLGAAVADHPQVEEIAEWLVKSGKQVSTSSLRAERISERFLDLLREGGQQNITVAPEAGNVETRKSMSKGVPDDKYFQFAEMAGQRRFPSLKLYFLIGTPGADPIAEATDIVQFSSQMGERFCGAGGGKITVAVSPFVPKPTTPWQGEAMWDPKAVKKATRIIRKELAFRGDMKVPPVNVKEARAEAILSWFGAEIADELLRLAREEISIETAFGDFDLARIPEQARTVSL